MIDQNRDGLIDVKDLQAIYAQIGQLPLRSEQNLSSSSKVIFYCSRYTCLQNAVVLRWSTHK